jgi:cellulose biosynthesis protein BcsQ
MILKIGIADANVEYVERMLSVLEGYDNLNLSVYTSRAALEQALTSRQFDVLLFDPSVYDGQMEVKKNVLTVMLLDEDSGVPETCRSFKKIKKYQRISKIYQQILELYAEICGDMGTVVGQRNVPAIAFYSPVGGVGKTTLALASAAKLAMQGYRCFYLNLEDIASEDCFLPQNAERGISEIASYLGENINFTMKIQSLLQSKGENLFYLNHFDSPNDIYEMSETEIVELLEQLKKTGFFDAIVIDMGVGIDHRALGIFEAVEKIVLVEKADAMAVRKLNGFLSQAHIMNEYHRKMYRVLNFDMGRGSNITSDVPLIGRINAAQNPDAAQFISFLANDTCSNFALQLL